MNSNDTFDPYGIPPEVIAPCRSLIFLLGELKTLIFLDIYLFQHILCYSYS